MKIKSYISNAPADNAFVVIASRPNDNFKVVVKPQVQLDETMWTLSQNEMHDTLHKIYRLSILSVCNECIFEERNLINRNNTLTVWFQLNILYEKAWRTPTYCVFNERENK